MKVFVFQPTTYGRPNVFSSLNKLLRYIEIQFPGAIYDSIVPKEIEVYEKDGVTYGNEHPRKGRYLGDIIEMEVDPIINPSSELSGLLSKGEDISDENQNGSQVRLSDLLDALSFLADSKCECSLQQQTGEDSSVCRSCSAAGEYNRLAADIRAVAKNFNL